MSKRSRAERQQRRAEEERAGELVSRRTLVTGAGVALGLLVLNQRHRIFKMFDRNPDVAQSTETVSEYGDIIFDEQNGNVDRTFECWNQMHPGPSLPVSLQKSYERFESFVEHQDHITNATITKINQGEPGTIHVFLEGFVGEPEQWGDASKLLDAIASSQEVLRDPRTRTAALKAIWAAAQAGDVSALNLLYSGARIVAYCKENGLKVAHGADPIGHPKFIESYHARLNLLVEGNEELTDERVTHCIQDIQDLSMKDETIRHEYIRKIMTEKVPSKGTGILVLGTSHFGVGDNFEKPSFPLENTLAQTPNTRTVVIQEKNLPTLLALPKNTLVLGTKTLRPEELRMYVSMMRKRRDSAK